MRSLATIVAVEKQWLLTTCVCVCVCVCAFVALGIQHAMRMRYFVICGMLRCIIFLHIVS